MISSTVTVTTTAAKILSAVPANRTVYLHVTGNGVVYLGNFTVSSTNGLLTEKAAVPLALEVPANEEVWAVVATGTEDLRILRPSYDGS